MSIRGLRYTVESLLELLASGMTVDELLAEYPDLERDDVRRAGVRSPRGWTSPRRASVRSVKIQKSLLSRRQRAFFPAPIGSIRPLSRMFASVFET